ncbi:MAG: hypothetical protein L0Y79_05535 [Chlorobi bacterium]|nr:hypothetical protein [Chlorobiota bacterium]MCI0716486.1 hypothetical protein [Chlorobiota bacterium]
MKDILFVRFVGRKIFGEKNKFLYNFLQNKKHFFIIIPDLLIGDGGRNYLLEVKMPNGVLTHHNGSFTMSGKGSIT